MDPVSLIVAALVAGGSKVATSAVQDAYAGLKSLLVARFRRQPDVAPRQEAVLTEHEEDPETYEKPVIKVLQQTGADQDEQILTAARSLLEQADPAGAAGGQYDLRGAQGVQVGGSGNTMTNTFNNPTTQTWTQSGTGTMHAPGAVTGDYHAST